MTGYADEPALPYGRHLIEDDDVAAVVAALKSGWLTTGPAVEAFEETLAGRVGAAHAASCSSGTAALHLAALALSLGPGDRVVVPALTFLATANAVRYVGAEVVFADVDPDTGLMGDSQLRDAMARATDGTVKAVFPVHLAGQCASMERIAAVAADRGLRVVEDACHALGSTYRSRNGESVRVGSCRHSDMTVFSFHPVKTVTMGEGGAVTTNDGELYRRLMRLRNHGMERDATAFVQADLAFDREGKASPWYYELQELGYNYRASDINCALGMSQLGKLDRFVAGRRALVAHYDTRLASLAPIVRPLGRVAGCQAAWHLYTVMIDFKAAAVERATVMRRLREAGIGTQVHYLPVHMQPYYRRRYGEQRLIGAETYYGRSLSLPLFAGMEERDVERVVSALTKSLGMSATE
jgi:UDP-4-amino-4,6-dideoxy-N-acetyl-beta-L-altrosamine transaminase